MSTQPRKKNRGRLRGTQKRFDNSLTQLAAGIRLASAFGNQETLSTYGTIQQSNNYSLISLNWIVLSYLYSTNGIFQTAIQLPIQDGFSRGIELESGEVSGDDMQEILDYMEEEGILETFQDFYTWVRLFGGGALIVNTNQDPQSPLDIRRLNKTPIDFIDVDRWQLGHTGLYSDWEDWFTSGGNNNQFWLEGVSIHESRVIRGRGKKAPHYLRHQLRGWGMADAERMIRDLNLYLKTQNVLYEILDESKIDVYHIKNLASKMITNNGTSAIQNRIQIANEIKSYLDAIVLDTEEEFEQKTMAFGGLAEVMRENRIGISSALRMPMTKLFGISSSGFNSGEDDLENYNAMVESEIRAKSRPHLRKVIDIVMMHKWGYVPSYKIKFPSLRVMKEVDQETVNTSKQNRILQLYDRGLIDSYEMMQETEKQGLITIETKASKGLLPPQPMPPADGVYDTGADKIT